MFNIHWLCLQQSNGVRLHDTLLKSNKNNPFLVGMNNGNGSSISSPAAAATAANVTGSPGRSRDRNVYGPTPASASVALPPLKGVLRFHRLVSDSIWFLLRFVCVVVRLVRR